jgi:hypothetical protein
MPWIRLHSILFFLQLKKSSSLMGRSNLPNRFLLLFLDIVEDSRWSEGAAVTELTTPIC